MRRALGLLGAVAVVAAATAFVTSRPPAPSPARPPAPPDALARLPLAFEENVGQFDAGVRFLARAPGQTVALVDDGLSVSPAGVRVTLSGARPARIGGNQPRPGTVSRIIGADPAQWRTSIPTYGSVTYYEAYPGVDVVFHGSGRNVEHDFVLRPGADPSVIAVAVSGAAARLDPAGDLVAGDVRFQAPTLYQEVDGARRLVTGRYAARPDGSYGFAVGPYDRSRTLVIDPVLVSSSYLGGSSTDTAYGAASDSDGNIVVTGYTESSDFPTLSPAQPGRPGAEGTRRDIFVSKVKADGSGLLWSTYLGGRGQDAAFGVALGPDGAVYVTGYVESPDFPTVKPLQARNAGGTDAFVVKLNPAGTTVEYATYVGGANADSGSGIAVDKTGAAYVVGATGSANFPVTKAIQATLARPDDQDGFALKIDPSGSSLLWSTFIGGSGDDHAIDAALDFEDNLYVTGDTKSANFPTVRPFQPNPGAAGTGVGVNFADAFVAKIRSDGTAFVYSSYLGGSDSDKGTGIAVDGAGNAYVTGNTGSTNFPVAAAFQPRKDGDFDAFVAKVRADGSGLAYASYLGGSGSDGGEAVAVDGAGHAYVVGATASNDFPTEKPAQSVKGGGFVDAFVTEVSASGNALAASSYLGGRDDDQAAGVTVDATGNVVVVGYTNSGDFPIAKPFQPGKGGGVGDAFLAKVRNETAADVAGSSGAGTSRHERRIRTLVTITGGLFLAAILQSVWLRRRPEPPAPPGGRSAPAPARPGAAEEEPLPAGVQYVPRRGRLESRSVDGRSFTAGPPGRTLLDDRSIQAAAGPHGPGDGEEIESDDLWGPDRPWRRSSRGPDWDASERPQLRPVERPESPPPAPRMPAPDLWTEGDAPPAAPPEPAPSVRAPVAVAPLAAYDEWSGPAAGDLAPGDWWGPLTTDVDVDEWLRDFGDAGAAAAVLAPAAPAPVAAPAAVERELAPAPAAIVVSEADLWEAAPDRGPAPEPPTSEPPTAPEPPTAHAPAPAPPEPERLRPAAEPAAASSTPAPEPPTAHATAPAPPEAERLRPAPEPAAAASTPAPEPPTVHATAPALPEPPTSGPPEPPAPPLPTTPAPAPPEPAPAVTQERPLSLSELLAEDFPIPEPAPLPPPAPAADPLRDLLDEELPIPAVVEREAAAAPEQAEPAVVGTEEDDALPPPPRRLLVNLFEPDPDDPLVQAQRAAEQADDKHTE